MHEMRVTKDTSLRELQNFADAAGDKAKIRARQSPDGKSIILYASNKRSGPSLFNGARRTDRQNAARSAVATVMAHTARLPGVRTDAMTAALAPVTQQLMGAGELRGAALKGLVSQARQDATPELPVHHRIKDAIQTGDAAALDALGDEWGAQIGARLNITTSPGQAKFLAIAPQDAKATILTGLTRNLGETSGPFAQSYEDASPELKAVVDRAYAHVVSQLPDRQTSADTIVLGGKEYRKAEHIADSGFGSIDVYQAKSGEKVVVKSPTIRSMAGTPESKYQEAVAEVKGHLAAEGTGHPNVVGLKGAIPSADGKELMVVLEYVPGIDGDAFIKTLTSAVADKKVDDKTAFTARLGVLHGMASGMQHVQGTQRVIHRDFKSGNVFLHTDGSVKVGDFGTALSGHRQQLSENAIANPRWLAPEVIIGKDSLLPIRKAMNKRADAERTALKAMEKELGPEKFQAAMAKTKKLQELRKEEQQYTITEKVDTWSLGITAYELFYGTTPFDQGDQFDSQIEERIADFVAAYAKDPTTRLLTAEKLGRPLTPIDRLINELTHPDPAQRPTLSAVLSNPVFAGVAGGQAQKAIASVIGLRQPSKPASD